MSRYIVFLYIDGVFTSSRQHIAADRPDGEMWAQFDPVAIQFMNRLHARYEIDWVIMSTWGVGLEKSDATTAHWVMAAFRNAGFRGTFPYPNWKVRDPGYRETRAHTVAEYLAAERLTYADFLIFDDTDYDFNRVLGVKRFIKTDPNDGLLTKHMKNTLSLTGNWEKKNGAH